MCYNRQVLLQSCSELVMIIYGSRDHAGGNEKMRLLVPGIKVYGGSMDNVKGCTDQVENGTKLSIGKEIDILCLHTPWYELLPSCHVT